MIRRFNFTKRKRIEQERVGIEMIEPTDGGPPSFHAGLDFDGLELPANAPVTIEVYRGRTALRFPWGTVGRLTPPLDRRLVNMPDNPSFRVKVVAPDGSGVLLGMANHIRPQREERHGSLVWLDASDLGKEVWRLEFGDGNPTLLVNRDIAGIEAAVQSDAAFRGLVMPEVLRAVIVWALMVGDADPEDDDGEWGELMRFVRSFYDAPLLSAASDGDNRAARMAWADAAVAAFTQKRFRASDDYTAALGRR